MPKFKATKKSKVAGMATSPAIHTIHEVVEAGRDNIKMLPELKKKVNSRAKYTIRKSGVSDENILVELRQSYGYVTLEMPNDLFDRLTGEYKSNVKKMFQFVLEEVNKQAFHEGQLTRDTVDFSATELIRVGFYLNEASGTKGFDSAMSFLTSIKLKGEVKYGARMQPVRQPTLDVMFYRVEHKEHVFTVYLNDKIDWNFVIHFFSRIPEYYYSLSSKAASMAYQIFFLARQNTQAIKERGCFRISLKIIRNALSLPLKSINSRRDIIEPVYNAIDEIEAAHKEHFCNEDLQIFIADCNDNMNAKEFISNGFLEICLSGEMARPFIEFEEAKAKKIAQARRKRKKSTNTAM